jgi:hypothetical protein
MDKDLNKTFGTIRTETLIEALRSFEGWRKSAHKTGVNDNVGAIHSAERIAEMLSLKIAYPGLTHINNLRHKEFAWFSINAKIAFDEDKKAQIEIEHVSPKRAYTIALLKKISETEDKVKIKKWVKENFKLALLTPPERAHLDKVNRTRMCPDRLKSVEINMCDEPRRTQ